jgi:hypothetical protein
MLNIDTMPRQEPDQAVRHATSEAERRQPKSSAEESERLVDIICSMMTERSSCGS